MFNVSKLFGAVHKLCKKGRKEEKGCGCNHADLCLAFTVTAITFCQKILSSIITIGSGIFIQKYLLLVLLFCLQIGLIQLFQIYVESSTFLSRGRLVQRGEHLLYNPAIWGGLSSKSKILIEDKGPFSPMAIYWAILFQKNYERQPHLLDKKRVLHSPAAWKGIHTLK